MAQFRQQTGADRFASTQVQSDDHVSIRIPAKQQARNRRQIRHDKSHRRLSPLVVFAVTLIVGLAVTLFAFRRLYVRKENGEESDSELVLGENQTSFSRELKFGHGSGFVGRDSRYWDKDDRRRDLDYDGDDALRLLGDDNVVNFGGGDQKVKEKGKVGGGLYNEGGRAELSSYDEKLEASARNEGQDRRQDEEIGWDDEHDDRIDVQDNREDEGRHADARLEESNKDGIFNPKEKDKNLWVARNGGGSKVGSSAHGMMPKEKPKHHKVSGPCEMKFLDSTAQIIEPIEIKKISRFSLQYTDMEERPTGSSNWEPRFAGHQTPQERENSFYARDQKINCGFVKSPEGYPSTGFDLTEDDVKFMSTCHIAVSSCIFGNSDRLRTPVNKLITSQSRKNVCFVMFMDEITLRTLSSEGQEMDSTGFIGLWKIVLVRNLPFTDTRRVGKIPKFLQHRLFPSARYSIWLDSKLRLQHDPYFILEYFLWRKGYEYAISNHYDRHCVWEEVEQNKKLNKYNHTVIDQQFEFYRSDGLKRFDPSDPNRLLPSYVPEGSFIIRAHTPMSNLFSCLWFNEVDHFTSRDQLSFAYTYLKLSRTNPGKPFHLNMFKDCERRKIAKLFHHRAEEKRTLTAQTAR